MNQEEQNEMLSPETEKYLEDAESGQVKGVKMTSQELSEYIDSIRED